VCVVVWDEVFVVLKRPEVEGLGNSQSCRLRLGDAAGSRLGPLGLWLSLVS